MYLKDELYIKLKESPEIFEFLQNGSLDGLWYWDIENPECEWMDDRFWITLGYDPSERKALAKEWQDLIFPEDLEKAIKNFNDHCKNPDHPYDQIVRYRHKNGKTVWIRCRGLAIRNEERLPIRMLGTHIDITELKELEQKFREASITDTLTGISNRRGFTDHLTWAVCHCCRSDQPLSIALVDVDHFKSVNDTFGHEQGDKTLVDVANQLKNSFRKNDFVSRWGGEEFIILMHDTDSDEAFQVCDRVCNDIENKVSIGLRKITVSIGVYTYKSTNDKNCKTCNVLDTIVPTVDKALYEAKNTGRNKVVKALPS